MTTILVDVDTQFDFMDPRGALYVPADASVETAIADLLARAESQSIPLLGSVDSHAFDAWEFEGNGGQFPQHCVKGTPGWLRSTPESPARTRFIPMQQVVDGRVAHLAGESERGAGARLLSADDLAREAMQGVGIYFEKEVYSLFSNPTAAPVIASLVEALDDRDLWFEVFGYCTGGYCVDAAALGLAELGYRVRVLAYATAAIGGETGLAKSREALADSGIECIESADAHAALRLDEAAESGA